MPQHLGLCFRRFLKLERDRTREHRRPLHALCQHRRDKSHAPERSGRGTALAESLQLLAGSGKLHPLCTSGRQAEFEKSDFRPGSIRTELRHQSEGESESQNLPRSISGGGNHRERTVGTRQHHRKLGHGFVRRAGIFFVFKSAGRNDVFFRARPGDAGFSYRTFRPYGIDWQGFGRASLAGRQAEDQPA